MRSIGCSASCARSRAAPSSFTTKPAPPKNAAAASAAPWSTRPSGCSSTSWCARAVATAARKAIASASSPWRPSSAASAPSTKAPATKTSAASKAFAPALSPSKAARCAAPSAKTRPAPRCPMCPNPPCPAWPRASTWVATASWSRGWAAPASSPLASCWAWPVTWKAWAWSPKTRPAWRKRAAPPGAMCCWPNLPMTSAPPAWAWPIWSLAATPSSAPAKKRCSACAPGAPAWPSTTTAHPPPRLSKTALGATPARAAWPTCCKPLAVTMPQPSWARLTPTPSPPV